MGLLGFKLTGAVGSFSESCPGLVVPGRGVQAARQSVSWETPGLSQKGIRSGSTLGSPELHGQCGGVGALPQHQWVPWGGCGLCLIDCGGFFPLAETSCAATEFRCRDGTCIGNSSRCNQFIDCEDASDEMNCSECSAAAPGPSSTLEMFLLSVLAAGTRVFGIWAGSGREEGPAPVLQPRDEAAPPHPCRNQLCHAQHPTTQWIPAALGMCGARMGHI